jgi:hypothetical protein
MSAMPNDIALPPTSTATTAETEPEVSAGILSGDIRPGSPLSFNADPPAILSGRRLLMLAAGAVAGCGVALWLRRGPQPAVGARSSPEAG